MFKKIILADCDNESRISLRDRLSDTYEVIEAEDFITAYRTAFHNYRVISAVIISNTKGDADYRKLVCDLHSNPLLSLMPIMIITRPGAVCTELQALTLGATDYMTFPVDCDIIKQRLRNLIRYREISGIAYEYKKVKESTERLNIIMENVGCGVTASTYDGMDTEIIFANDKFYSLFGYTKKEYDNRFSDTMGPVTMEDKYRMYEAISLAFERGTPVSIEHSATRKDGSTIWIKQRFSTTRFFGIDGKVVVAILDDITQEKEADDKAKRANEDMLLRNQLVNDSSSAIYVCDADTRLIKFMNKTCARMCKKDPERAYGKLCYEYIKGAEKPCDYCDISCLSRNDYSENEISDASTGRHYINKSKLIDWNGQLSIVNYTDDITDRISTRTKLQASRRALETASKNSGVSFWQFDIDEKTVYWGEYINNNYAGYPEQMKNMPDTMINSGEVHPDDADDFRRMYDEMYADAETAESTVRIYDHIKEKYCCYHTVYTRVYDSSYTSRIAVGFCENVDLQQEIKHRYESELKIREAMSKNAAILYELNLTTKTLVEYQSKYDLKFSFKPFTPIDSKLTDSVMRVVDPEFRRVVIEKLYIKPLIESYNRGDTNSELKIKLNLPSVGARWVRVKTKTSTNPQNGNIIVFICIYDVNNEEINKIALSSVIKEGLESLSIINVKTGKARLVKSGHDIYDAPGTKSFDHNSVMMEAIEHYIAEGDREKCREFFDLNNLAAVLADGFAREITMTVTDNNGYIKRKRSCAYFLDEKHENIVITRRDVTGMYEEEQRQKAVLKAAADAANEANKAKGEFLSRMSHDMRTPMNAILGMTYLAKNEKSPEKIEEYLTNIDTSSHFLLGLINDVLDLSKIESGRAELREEVYDFDEFIRGINTIIKPLMEAKNLNFEMKMGCGTSRIIVDKLRFNQIFFNLLSNASKYTPSGGTVVFEAVYIPPKDGKYGMRFFVRDNGIGMSESFLKVIFTPFSQDKSSVMSEKQGTGLGLAIVKNLVEMMGGSVSVESKLGEGSEFTIDLYAKLALGDKDETNPPLPDYSILEGVNALVVDDNYMNIMLAENLLIKKGCRVTVANNGKEALEMFLSSPEGYFGLIIMDVRMPVMDGIKATELIRAANRSDARDVIIVAMTADAFKEDTLKTIESGMNAHVLKPIEPDLFYNLIISLLKKQTEIITKEENT